MLPSAAELQSASFLDSVRHAETLLGFRATTLSAENAALVDTMLGTSNGARGFFVTLLSQPAVLLAEQEPLPCELDRLLRKHCRVALVADLIVKNLVMSSAMALQYRGDGKSGLASGSALTSARSATVARATYRVGGSSVPALVDRMLYALEGKGVADGGMGVYVPFVEKWGYDDAQRRHCAAVLCDAIAEDV